MFYPEIEDLESLESLLLTKEHVNTDVDYLEATLREPRWKEQLDDEALAELVKTIPSTRDVVLRIFFIKVTSHEWYKTGDTIQISPKSLRLLRDQVGMSNMFISSFYGGGQWTVMGDGRFVRKDHEGEPYMFELLYRPVSGWREGYSLIQLRATAQCSTYFCVNYSEDVKKRLYKVLTDEPSLARRPFFIDTLAANHMIQQWAKIINKERLSLISIEKAPLVEKVKYGQVNLDVTSTNLHQLSRTWHILLQDLSDSKMTVKFLEDSYRSFITFFPKTLAEYEADPSICYGRTDDSLRFLASRLSVYEGWAGNYRDRTIIRINLLFHLTNQQESRTNTRIADQTAKVAQLTQRDSASMITIAAVTMFFLPGTFVSAILSTTFFAFGESGLSVSRQWWVFLAVTVPLTIVVFGIWYAWRQWRIRNDVTSVDDADEKAGGYSSSRLS